MKWMRFTHRGVAAFGVLEGDRVQTYAGDLFDAPIATGESVAIAEIAWMPPCVPGKIIGLWNNYRASAEKNGWTTPAAPLYFLKSPGSATGHLRPIAVPASCGGRVVYEGELAVVIGRRCRSVAIDEAASAIFGYTCANDVTAIELLHSDPSFPQWTRAKSFDGFAAFGPVIDTAFDPATATLRTIVGGRVRQDYPLSDMFFGPAELVAQISRDMTLEAGDVIFCGTSLGVLPMKPGTTVEIVVDGIGTLSNVYG